MRFDDIAEHFGDQIDLTWKSFLLRTEPKATTMEKFTSYTQSWKRPAEAEPRAVFNTWSGENEPPSTSLPAQVAHKVVQANWPDAASAMHDRLLTSYFTENRTISDWDVLADIASQAGIDQDDFLLKVAEQREPMARLVIDEHNEAIEQGITAVPTLLLNNALPIPGAQDLDSYILWIEKIIDRQRQAESD